MIGKRCAVILLTAAFVLGMGAPDARAQDDPPGQYEIKAAFLYKFIDFIEWPPQGSRNADPTLTIGILGRDPFGDALQLINGKTIKGKRLVIKHMSRVQDMENLYVLFISPSEKENLKRILQETRNASVLTISEMDGFPQNGGVINLTTERNRVRFEINPDAAERAGLKISSQLLKLAKIVRA